MSCRCSDDAKHVLAPDPILFSGRRQFCEAMFHCSPCYEWNMNGTICLNEPKCYRSVIYAVARLFREGKEVYAARYKNCYRGSSAANIHAEEFMIPDLTPRLKEMKEEEASLLLYLTLQPCHYSGGCRHVKGNGKSCTELMIQFAREHPELDITIRCSNIYRAHYTEPDKFSSKEAAEQFRERVELARKGIRMLATEPNIDVNGMRAEDWCYLMSKLKGDPCITQEQWTYRLEMDKHVGQFLRAFK